MKENFRFSGDIKPNVDYSPDAYKLAIRIQKRKIAEQLAKIKLLQRQRKRLINRVDASKEKITNLKIQIGSTKTTTNKSKRRRQHDGLNVIDLTSDIADSTAVAKIDNENYFVNVAQLCRFCLSNPTKSIRIGHDQWYQSETFRMFTAATNIKVRARTH